jgi:hypothetical protein
MSGDDAYEITSLTISKFDFKAKNIDLFKIDNIPDVVISKPSDINKFFSLADVNSNKHKLGFFIKDTKSLIKRI